MTRRERSRDAEDRAALARLVRAALAEDVGAGDVTTEATIPFDRRGRAEIVANGEGIVAGLGAAAETYRQVDPRTRYAPAVEDGARVRAGGRVAEASGRFASLLVAERTALNFLQRLSGIATLTARFVAAVEGTGAAIADTRKTTPGWRALEKAAVVAGGGRNHRRGLYDAFLIKENHLAGAGGGAAALSAVAARNRAGLPVEIEVRSLEELDEALAADPPPDRVLCDHFGPDLLREAVRRARGREPPVLVEASGAVTLDTVRSIAESGVDWISVGALTHSAPALDLSCRIEPL